MQETRTKQDADECVEQAQICRYACVQNMLAYKQVLSGSQEIHHSGCNWKGWMKGRLLLPTIRFFPDSGLCTSSPFAK